VAKKIDLAGDYVKKVHGYMQGEKAGLYDDGGMTEIKKMPKGTGTMYGVKEDAGEGHMSKSTLYHTAKYAIQLMQMIKKGDDLEGWVQSKINKAADYLQGAYNYEEYQKLSPYREDLDGSTFVKHKEIIKKNIDEILARETDIDDTDTKPGMMRILGKRVNEVEKKMSQQKRKEPEDEEEDDVLPKDFDDQPREKGQKAKSKKHSDLYTDEDPKGTIQGLGFKDDATARASVTKIRKSGKTHAHKIQAAVAMEQRAKAAGKTGPAAIYRKYINSMKKKTKAKNK